MVTLFDQTWIEIKVYYILIGRRIAKEDTLEVVLVKVALAGARLFDTYPQAKQFQVTQIGFHPIEALKWCFLSDAVNKLVV